MGFAWAASERRATTVLCITRLLLPKVTLPLQWFPNSNSQSAKCTSQTPHGQMLLTKAMVRCNFQYCTVEVVTSFSSTHWKISCLYEPLTFMPNGLHDGPINQVACQSCARGEPLTEPRLDWRNLNTDTCWKQVMRCGGNLSEGEEAALCSPLLPLPWSRQALHTLKQSAWMTSSPTAHSRDIILTEYSFVLFILCLCDNQRKSSSVPELTFLTAEFLPSLPLLCAAELFHRKQESCNV